MSQFKTSGTLDSCICELHEEACQRILQLSSEFIKLNNYSALPAHYTDTIKQVCNGAKRNGDNCICSACAMLIQEKYEAADTSSGKKRKLGEPDDLKLSSHSNQDIIDMVSKANFSKSELEKLFFVMASKVGRGLSDDIATKCDEQPSARLEMMSSCNVQSQWETVYGPIRTFFEGLVHTVCKIKQRDVSNEAHAKRTRIMLHCVESMYAALNNRYVSPTALAEMLLIYFLSNSRRAAEVHGLSSGCASFASLQTALASISSKIPKLPTAGYLVLAFDNNQVFGKTYRIQVDSKYRVSIITTVAAFSPEIKANPQSVSRIFPAYQQLDTQAAKTLLQKLKIFRATAAEYVNLKFNTFFEKRIRHLMQPAYFDKQNSAFEDYVDLKSAFAPEKIGMEYSEVPLAGSNCIILDQPCILENPNSYRGVEIVLDEIVRTSITPERCWITLVADGLPYSIAEELIRHKVLCHICSQSFMDNSIRDHYKKAHDQIPPAQLKRKYTQILIRPGAGHFEMNLIRSIFSEWFAIFVEPVAQIMGFCTEKAKLVCASACDHHKAWELLEIVFEALTDELVLGYLRDFYFENPVPDANPTYADLESRVSKSCNLYLQAAYKFISKACFPLFLFRSGIRQSNFKVSLYARECAAAIFYAFHHPKYQKLNCYDVCELQQLAPELREAVFADSYRIPNSKIGQGVDFLLEQRNKKLKAFVLHNGIPTPEQWTQASRSLPTLEEIVATVQERLGLKLEQQDSKHSLAAEKRAARQYYRDGKYLQFSRTCTLSVREDVPVSEDFLMWFEIAESNREKYYEEFVLSGKAKIPKVVKAFSKPDTPDTWSVKKLREEIRLKSDFVPVDRQQGFIKGLSVAKKEQLLKRYHDIIQVLDDITLSVEI